MGSSAKQTLILSALQVLLWTAWAINPDIEGFLTFRSLTKLDMVSSGNSSAKAPDMFSLLAARYASDSPIFGRQEEFCPPEAPVEVGTIMSFPQNPG
jgi:hypothetical protein